MKKTGLFQNETLFFYTYIAHNGQIYKTTAASLDVCRKLRDNAICPPLLPDIAT